MLKLFTMLLCCLSYTQRSPSAPIIKASGIQWTEPKGTGKGNLTLIMIPQNNSCNNDTDMIIAIKSDYQVLSQDTQLLNLIINQDQNDTLNESQGDNKKNYKSSQPNGIMQCKNKNPPISDLKMNQETTSNESQCNRYKSQNNNINTGNSINVIGGNQNNKGNQQNVNMNTVDCNSDINGQKFNNALGFLSEDQKNKVDKNNIKNNLSNCDVNEFINKNVASDQQAIKAKELELSKMTENRKNINKDLSSLVSQGQSSKVSQSAILSNINSGRSTCLFNEFFFKETDSKMSKDNDQNKRVEQQTKTIKESDNSNIRFTGSNTNGKNEKILNNYENKQVNDSMCVTVKLENIINNTNQLTCTANVNISSETTKPMCVMNDNYLKEDQNKTQNATENGICPSSIVLNLGENDLQTINDIVKFVNPDSYYEVDKNPIPLDTRNHTDLQPNIKRNENFIGIKNENTIALFKLLNAPFVNQSATSKPKEYNDLNIFNILNVTQFDQVSPSTVKYSTTLDIFKFLKINEPNEPIPSNNTLHDNSSSLFNDKDSKIFKFLNITESNLGNKFKKINKGNLVFKTPTPLVANKSLIHEAVNVIKKIGTDTSLGYDRGLKHNLISRGQNGGTFDYNNLTYRPKILKDGLALLPDDGESQSEGMEPFKAKLKGEGNIVAIDSGSNYETSVICVTTLQSNNGFVSNFNNVSLSLISQGEIETNKANSQTKNNLNEIFFQSQTQSVIESNITPSHSSDENEIYSHNITDFSQKDKSDATSEPNKYSFQSISMAAQGARGGDITPIIYNQNENNSQNVVISYQRDKESDTTNNFKISVPPKCRTSIIYLCDLQNASYTSDETSNAATPTNIDKPFQMFTKQEASEMSQTVYKPGGAVQQTIEKITLRPEINCDSVISKFFQSQNSSKFMQSLDLTTVANVDRNTKSLNDKNILPFVESSLFLSNHNEMDRGENVPIFLNSSSVNLNELNPYSNSVKEKLVNFNSNPSDLINEDTVPHFQHNLIKDNGHTKIIVKKPYLNNIQSIHHPKELIKMRLNGKHLVVEQVPAYRAELNSESNKQCGSTPNTNTEPQSEEIEPDEEETQEKELKSNPLKHTHPTTKTKVKPVTTESAIIAKLKTAETTRKMEVTKITSEEEKYTTKMQKIATEKTETSTSIQEEEMESTYSEPMRIQPIEKTKTPVPESSEENKITYCQTRVQEKLSTSQSGKVIINKGKESASSTKYSFKEETSESVDLMTEKTTIKEQTPVCFTVCQDNKNSKEYPQKTTTRIYKANINKYISTLSCKPNTNKKADEKIIKQEPENKQGKAIATEPTNSDLDQSNQYPTTVYKTEGDEADNSGKTQETEELKYTINYRNRDFSEHDSATSRTHISVVPKKLSEQSSQCEKDVYIPGDSVKEVVIEIVRKTRKPGKGKNDNTNSYSNSINYAQDPFQRSAISISKTQSNIYGLPLNNIKSRNFEMEENHLKKYDSHGPQYHKEYNDRNYLKGIPSFERNFNAEGKNNPLDQIDYRGRFKERKVLLYENEQHQASKNSKDNINYKSKLYTYSKFPDINRNLIKIK